MKKGLQLYNFRNQLKEDFKGALKEIAKLGFEGVEFAGDYGNVDPAELAAYLKELKLECCGAMFGEAEILDPANKAYDYARALKTPAVTFSIMVDFKARYAEVLKKIADAGEAAAKNNFVFSYHNHWAEFTDIDGIPAMERILSETDHEKVFMEPDVCWVTRGGQKPADFIRKHGKRIRQVHLKDIVVPTDYNSLTELGKGCVDLAGSIAAAKEIGAEWGIYEQDLTKDPFQSAKEAIDFLKKAF